MTATIDTLDSTGARDTSGWRFERVAVLEDIDGSPEARIFRALTHPSLPAFGSPHPAQPGALLLESSCELLGASQARVRLVYRTPNKDDDTTGGVGAGQVVSIEIDSTTTQETVTKDYAGNLMFFTYRGTGEGVVGLNGIGVTGVFQTNRVVEVSVLKPQLSVRVTQDRATRPLALASDITGTVNSVTWSGYPPRTWLQTGVRSSLQNGRWRTEFSFAYRPETWDYTEILTINGQTPTDAVPGNGIQTYRVYPEDTWQGLGFSL